MPTYDLYPAVDATFNFPPEIRVALAASAELRNTVLPLSTTQRNNLSGTELWDGRMIYNTTTKRFNKYDLGSTSWVALPDLADIKNPTGTIQMWLTGAVPAGYLVLDGSVVSRSGANAALFALWGTAFNTGGEAGTDFRLPNFKGRFPVGQDTAQTEFDVLGEVGGAKTVTLTAAQMPSHTHTGPSHTHTGPSHDHGAGVNSSGGHEHSWAGTNISWAGNGTGSVTRLANQGSSQSTSGGGGHSHGINADGTQATGPAGTGATGSAGTDAAHPNLPPYMVMRFIVAL